MSTGRAGDYPFDNSADSSQQGLYVMWFSRLFYAGVLIGLAFGMVIGAALADGKKDVNYTAIAGVGTILAIIAGVTIRSGSTKS